MRNFVRCGEKAESMHIAMLLEMEGDREEQRLTDVIGYFCATRAAGRRLVQ